MKQLYSHPFFYRGYPFLTLLLLLGFSFQNSIIWSVCTIVLFIFYFALFYGLSKVTQLKKYFFLILIFIVFVGIDLEYLILTYLKADFSPLGCAALFFVAFYLLFYAKKVPHHNSLTLKQGFKEIIFICFFSVIVLLVSLTQELIGKGSLSLFGYVVVANGMKTSYLFQMSFGLFLWAALLSSLFLAFGSSYLKKINEN